jgi:hypothetical protein
MAAALEPQPYRRKHDLDARSMYSTSATCTRRLRNDLNASNMTPSPEPLACFSVCRLLHDDSGLFFHSLFIAYKFLSTSPPVPFVFIEKLFSKTKI